MDVAFVALTESCTYLLDAGGICRWCAPSPGAGEEARNVAKKCVGAQYVASLDAREAGVLVHDPKPGRALVFAKVDEKGRVSLLRSGTLIDFQALDAPASAAQPEAQPALADESAELPTIQFPPVTRRAEAEVEAAAAAAEAEAEVEVETEDETGTETVPFSRERPSLIELAKSEGPPRTLRGLAPPPGESARRGMLPRRSHSN